MQVAQLSKSTGGMKGMECAGWKYPGSEGGESKGQGASGGSWTEWAGPGHCRWDLIVWLSRHHSKGVD